MNVRITGVLMLASFGVGAVLALKTMRPAETVKEVIKDHIVTITHTEKAKNGTTITSTTTTTDISDTKAETKNLNKLNYALGLSYNTKAEMGVEVSKRLLGNFWISAAATKSTAVLGVRYEF